MANISVTPLVLKNIELTVGADDYKTSVSSVRFEPSASQVSWTGLGGNTHTDVSTATWTVTLEFAQDWDTTNSLSRYLFAQEGTTKAIKFRPKNGVGPSFTANVAISPGAIGGAVNAYATASVTLGSDKPVLVTV